MEPMPFDVLGFLATVPGLRLLSSIAVVLLLITLCTGACILVILEVLAPFVPLHAVGDDDSLVDPVGQTQRRLSVVF